MPWHRTPRYPPEGASKVIRKLALPPYTVDGHVFQRFDQRNTVFARKSWDREAKFYNRDIHENVGEVMAEGKAGYSRMEYARSLAAWTVCDHFQGAYSWEALGHANHMIIEFGKYAVVDRAAMTEEIKNTARAFGADLVGVCRLDRRWVYSHNTRGDPMETPQGIEYAVVMAIQMDAAAIRTSPAFSAATAVGIGYSRMAFTIACLAEFIRNLGYSAIPMGNDTALSIPMAIDAGLGELGRNGLLITPQQGPCVRLCKVFTDLPLETDQPIEFGAARACRRCAKCADACEVGAISREPEPSFDVACPSNNGGILRWAVNHDKCYGFWVDNGADCATCIAACPFTPRDIAPLAESREE